MAVQLLGIGEWLARPFVRDAWPEVFAVEARQRWRGHDDATQRAGLLEFAHGFCRIVAGEGAVPEPAQQDLAQLHRVEGFVIAQLVEVQHNEFFAVAVQEVQDGFDQIVEHPMGLVTTVMEIEDRLVPGLLETQAQIECPCAVVQLPGKGIVLAGHPVAEDHFMVGGFFVHAGVVRAGPDDVGQSQLVDVGDVTHPGLFVQWHIHSFVRRFPALGTCVDRARPL